MKPTLDYIIQKLATDAMFAITVENIDVLGNESRIETNLTQIGFDEKYGGVDNFINTIQEKGVKHIRIKPRKQNGTVGGKVNYKPVMEPIDLEFQEAISLPIPQTKENSPMNGANLNMSGLHGVEIFRVHHYDTLLKENAEYKAEINELKKANEKLKEDNLRNEIMGQKSLEKAQAQNEMLNSPLAATLAQVLAAKVMPTAPAPVGLGQPSSPLKEQFCKLDDSFLQDVLPVVNGMATNDEFSKELEELLTKYNLINGH